MLFWVIILLISTLTVVTVGMPFLRGRASQGEGSKKGALDYTLLGALAMSPVFAAVIYLNVGAPNSWSSDFTADQPLPGAPAGDIATLPPEERAAMIEGMVSGLAAKLEEDPSDLDGWRMLARSYAALGRTVESVGAFREVINRDENAGPEDWRNFATAMLAARGPGPGPYSEEFKGSLETLKGFNQDDPLALFYLGLVARDEGEPETALTHWRRLDEIIPEDAPITAQLRSMIDETEQSAVTSTE